jgi:hypothetical protein
MSIFVPNTGELPNKISNIYGYYYDDEFATGVPFGVANPNYGSIVVDSHIADPIDPQKPFAKNNDRPIAVGLDETSINSNDTHQSSYYPEQENFGTQSPFQYIYNGPNKDRIGVF